MDKGLKISQHGVLVGFVVLLAAVLRFYKFWDLPFMHDEFSAILRTYFDSFSQLIEQGVIPDSHPAGVQVFIYFWIKLFGLSEAGLKFPFILLGTLSVYLIYLLGKQWFGKTTGLLAASVFGVMQFGIFYSQLARPYSPGLFFVLLSTYFWTKIVFEENTKTLVVSGYVLAAVFASYGHVFSLLFIFVQGVSGLVFLKKREVLRYVVVNAVVLLLYIPNLSIFYAQLSRGDIGGWLREPSNRFLIEFFEYAFHFSWMFTLVSLAVAILLPFFYINKNKASKKFRFLALLWFFVSYIIAYLYSVFRFPVIQYSTLLFVFPYLLLFVFSFVGSPSKWVKYAAVVFISLSGVISLVANRQHYLVMYTQGFDGIPKEIAKDVNLNKKPHPTVVMQAPNHWMFKYYFEKTGLDTSYYKLNNDFNVEPLNIYLQGNTESDLLFGWADYSRLEYLEFFKDRYKYIVNQRQFFNSEYYHFSNKIKGELVGDSRRFVATTGLTGEAFLLKSKTKGYSKAIEIGLDTVEFSKFDVINLRAEIVKANKNVDALLVFDLRDKNGEVLSWSASKISDFYYRNDNDERSCFVYHSKRLLSLYPFSEGAVLKTYIWKRDTTYLEVKNTAVYITNINPIENGLYDNIP